MSWTKDIQLIDSLFDKQRKWYLELSNVINDNSINYKVDLIKSCLLFISYYNDLITEELNKIKGETNENK